MIEKEKEEERMEEEGSEEKEGREEEGREEEGREEEGREEEERWEGDHVQILTKHLYSQTFKCTHLYLQCQQQMNYVVTTCKPALNSKSAKCTMCKYGKR